MVLKRGYKQTEVGVIPEDWEVKEIGEFNPFITSGSRGWASFYSDIGYPFIRITNLSRGSIYLDLDDIKYVSLPPSENEGKRTQLLDGDVLISITADIGIIGYVTPSVPKPAFINQHIALVRFPPAWVNSRYISYFLASKYSQDKFQAMTDKGAKAGMNLLTVRKILFALPPLPEQNSIAAALSDVDALLAALEALIAKNRLIQQGAMQELLTGRRRLPGFSGEWEIVKFEDVADRRISWSLTGGPFGSNLKASDYTSDGIRIIQLQNIGDGIFYDEYAIFTSEKKADELISCNIYPGEIILSKMGDPVARACFVPTKAPRYLMASDGIRLAVNKKRFDKDFVLFYINSPYFRKKAVEASSGSTRQRIGLEDLKKLPFVAPSLSEQEAIGKIMSDMDSEIYVLEQQREKTRQIKQGMMQELLTGRIRLYHD